MPVEEKKELISQLTNLRSHRLYLEKQAQVKGFKIVCHMNDPYVASFRHFWIILKQDKSMVFFR